MEISKDLLTVFAHIIPLLLLASFLDSDVLRELRSYSKKAQYSWLSIIALILFGLSLTLISIVDGAAEGWMAWFIWVAVFTSVVNVFGIALWRVTGVSFLYLMGIDTKDAHRKKVKRNSK